MFFYCLLGLIGRGPVVSRFLARGMNSKMVRFQGSVPKRQRFVVVPNVSTSMQTCSSGTRNVPGADASHPSATNWPNHEQGPIDLKAPCSSASVTGVPVTTGKFKFPFPRRGIGRVDVDEEALPSVWNFYSYNPITDRSQCKFCGYMLAGKNCTNLRVHLKTKHSDIFEFDPVYFNL